MNTLAKLQLENVCIKVYPAEHVNGPSPAKKTLSEMAPS
jgi:hypothetical protein